MKARPFGIVALIGVLSFVVIAVTVQVLRTDLVWIEAPLSFYLLGTYGHWLQLAYGALAIALVALAHGCRVASHGSGRSLAPWLLFAGAGVALCVTAWAHSNLPGRAPTIEGVVHGIAAPAAFLCVTVAMLLQSWWFRRDLRWRARFPWAFGLAAICFLAMWVDALWHGMPRGLEQRLVIAPIILWLLLVALGLAKTDRDRA